MIGYGRIFFRLRLGRPASWRGSGRSRRSGTRTGATAARRPTAPGTPPWSPPPPPRSTTPSDRSRPRRAGSSRDLARRRCGLAQAHGRAGPAGRRLQGLEIGRRTASDARGERGARPHGVLRRAARPGFSRLSSRDRPQGAASVRAARPWARHARRGADARVPRSRHPGSGPERRSSAGGPAPEKAGSAIPGIGRGKRAPARSAGRPETSGARPHPARIPPRRHS